MTINLNIIVRKKLNNLHYSLSFYLWSMFVTKKNTRKPNVKNMNPYIYSKSKYIFIFNANCCLANEVLLTWMTWATCCEKISNKRMSFGIPGPSPRCANIAKRSINAIMIFFTFTSWCNSAHAFKNAFSVWRWNSSGKT